MQGFLHEQGIKFHPNRSAALLLNGKVERSKKTDKLEFYFTINLGNRERDRLLEEWEHCYNWERLHSSLVGKHLWIGTWN